MTTHVHEIPAPSARRPGANRTRWFGLAVLCVTLLMVTLDVTVLNVARPTIVRDLNATTTQLQWIVDAYVIVFAGLLLSVGSLADRIGRKKVFLAGLVMFAAGSIWAAAGHRPVGRHDRHRHRARTYRRGATARALLVGLGVPD
jgi:MFS family permease